MAAVRDPAFWRRFSVAVHLDEEAQSPKPTTTRPSLKHSDSWLQRERSKQSRRVCICWIFWLCFLALVAGIVIVVLWLQASGLLDGKGPAS